MGFGEYHCSACGNIYGGDHFPLKGSPFCRDCLDGEVYDLDVVLGWFADLPEPERQLRQRVLVRDRAQFEAASRMREAIAVLDRAVEVNPAKANGKPVILGTRFTVARFLAELAEGRSAPGLIEDFDLPSEPALTLLWGLARLLDGRPIRPTGD